MTSFLLAAQCWRQRNVERTAFRLQPAASRLLRRGAAAASAAPSETASAVAAAFRVAFGKRNPEAGRYLAAGGVPRTRTASIARQ